MGPAVASAPGPFSALDPGNTTEAPHGPTDQRAGGIVEEDGTTERRPASPLLGPTTTLNRRRLVSRGAKLGAAAVGGTAGPGVGPWFHRVRAQDEQIVVFAQQFSHEPLQPFIDELTEATGITVEFFANPSAGGDQVAQLTRQFAASSSPVVVLSSSDEAAPLFVRAGWMEPLNDIIAEGFWDDWDQSVRDYVAIGSTVDDQVYRIPHG